MQWYTLLFLEKLQIKGRQNAMQTAKFNRQYYAIDLTKFLCAILVVMIHVKPLGNAPSKSLLDYVNFGIQNYIARIAVPFFFVSSGFLLYRKSSYIHFSIGFSKKYILHMFRLYFIWTLIYFPLAFRGFFNDEKGFLHACLAYLRNIVFTGSYMQLWYFPALIFSVCLISFLLFKGVNPRVIVIIAFMFYIIGLFAQSWYGLIVPLKENIPELWNALRLTKKIIVTTRNGLFDAFFFVSMGMYFSFFGIKVRAKKAFLLFAFSMFAMGVEVFVLQYAGFIRAYDMYFFLVPASFFFFSFIAGLQLPYSPVYKTLRLLSSLIFYSHLWAYLVVSKLLHLVYSSLLDTCIRFMLTLILTIAFSFAVIKLSNCKGFKWLKVLYT
ncbi:MAG: acyltransferase [Clostridia bacterium]|nr:acyltransferase [Clostridia bacterium]